MGIIPAHAGSTRLPESWCWRWRDHPRVCGEHRCSPDGLGVEPGSSPRMRGARSIAKTKLVVFGIIPAYAGSTRSSRAPVCSLRDHPRVCGEHMERSNNSELRAGSSPRMRGALCRGRSLSKRTGIIPAYTGSTNRVTISMSSVRDHPRICGEHSRRTYRGGAPRGSSPRMRGAHAAHRDGRLGGGIIPAYAGSTITDGRADVWARDHPRVCGEHLVFTPPVSFALGSSPRMRGALRGCEVERDHAGIIPAYAGSTCPLRRRT